MKTLTILMNIDEEEVALEHYCGWSEPGRTPELNFSNDSHLPVQILKMCECLQGIARKRITFSERLLEKMTGYTPSAWRQVRPIMMKMGILNCRISENQVINSSDPVSKVGKTFNLLTKKRMMNKENFHELRILQQMIWADLLMHYKSESPSGLYPVRAILKTIKRNQYLDKTEWDIMTTFIEKNDNLSQECIVDSYIQKYREEPELFVEIKRMPGKKKGPKGKRQSIPNCRNTYWKNLHGAGLVKIEKHRINGKLDEVITIDYQFEKIVEAILSNDFFEFISKAGE